MVSFESDYTTGAHEAILQALVATNREPASGYGTDPYTMSAKDKIRKACGCPEADIYFLVGGTQTNQMVISTVLAPYEGVVAASTGHVNVHEAGAIEYSGHKVMVLPHHDGKIDAEELRALVKGFYADGNYLHMVFPGMVYISFPTENGTIYSKKELEDIYAICQEYEMKLFIDGARLGYGLASEACDVTLEELAHLCDVFYIGGTKVGALCGEAIVFPKNDAPKGFYTMTKQHGAMLAKGKLLGIQFDVLFTDDLYFKISAHAMEKAKKLEAILMKSGFPFFQLSPTNQQYIVMDNASMTKLKEAVAFSFWENVDADHTAVRFVTSWSTTDEDLQVLEDALNKLAK